MKAAPEQKRSWQVIAYCGVFLALTLVVLAVILLRTAGVVEGGPVPWYFWLFTLLGIAVSLYGLLGKKHSNRFVERLELVMLALYGGVLLIRLSRGRLLEMGWEGLRLVAIIAVVMVILIFCVSQQGKIEREEEEAIKRRREEKLAELRRSMAPTQKENGQSAGGGAERQNIPASGEGQKTP